MKQLFPRGKRIRPTDKDLVFYTALASLLPVFLLVVLLFHIGQIAGTNWQEVSLSQIVQDVNIPYLLFSMGVAGLVCLTAVLLFWRYRRDEVKQLIHRQKLARMVLENKWYESEQRKEDAFFKDLSSSRSKETIPNWEHLVSVIRSRNISAHLLSGRRGAGTSGQIRNPLRPD